jgi:hypothetical protein
VSPQEYAKAIVAGVTAGGGALATAPSGGKPTTGEIIGVVCVAVVAAGAGTAAGTDVLCALALAPNATSASPATSVKPLKPLVITASSTPPRHVGGPARPPAATRKSGHVRRPIGGRGARLKRSTSFFANGFRCARFAACLSRRAEEWYDRRRGAG